MTTRINQDFPTSKEILIITKKKRISRVQCHKHDSDNLSFVLDQESKLDNEYHQPRILCYLEDFILHCTNCTK